MEEKKPKLGENHPGSSAGRKKKDGNAGAKGPRRDPGKTVLMWLAIAVAVVFALRSIEGYSAKKETKISYSQFQEVLANPEITITQRNYHSEGAEQVRFLC